MAIVKTYHFGHATVHIADDAYRDASREEIARRVQHMLDVAGEILYNAQMRELESLCHADNSNFAEQA